jgi:Mg-chelatase subunit ChlD
MNMLFAIYGRVSPVGLRSAPVSSATTKMYAVVLSCAFALLFCRQALSSTPTQNKSQLLRGTVNANEVIDALERLGIKCVIHDGKPASVIVSEVRMGSPASYAGMDSGDKLLKVQSAENSLQILIGRANKSYQVNLNLPKDCAIPARTNFDLFTGLAQRNGTSKLNGTAKTDLLNGSVVGQNTALSAGHATKDAQGAKWPVVDVTQPNPAVKDTHVNVPELTVKQKEEKLRKYDIELIIDCSGSFKDVDGTDGLTKFEWCHRQVRDLAQRMSAYSKTMTITTFNQNFQVMPHCDPSTVEHIYAETEPNGSTDLVDPLMDRLQANLQSHDSAHPFLLAIITDGLPNVPRDPKVVDNAIAEFTHRLKSGDEVVITFLQIGDTFDGKDFCQNLDDNLVSEGAKYDIVDTKTFDQLKQEGLVNALVDAVLENRPLTASKTGPVPRPTRFQRSMLQYSHSSTASDAAVKRLQDERHSLEQQILGK